jgi:hypothetical protein
MLPGVDPTSPAQEGQTGHPPLPQKPAKKRKEGTVTETKCQGYQGKNHLCLGYRV